MAKRATQNGLARPSSRRKSNSLQKKQLLPIFTREATSRPISSSTFGLIQEVLQDNLYHMLIQAILWNQTTGRAARPVLNVIIALYPTPSDLANADVDQLTAIILPIGLHNVRARRLIALAKAWENSPPCKERRYRRVGYPSKDSGKDVRPKEVLDELDQREGWEVAHLPGIGAYALDSYRIFHRDKLRGVQPGVEPEWKRVVPEDKELKAWLSWRWALEDVHFDVLTGTSVKLSSLAEA